MAFQVKMAYGKNADGQPVHIKNAARGLECGCFCIECGSKLVAKKGNVLDWHFAHHAETHCGGYSPETLLHYRAKHLFANAIKHHGLHDLLPDWLFDAEEYSEYDDYGRLICNGVSRDLGIVVMSWHGVNLMRELIPDKNCSVVVEGQSPCGTYRPDISVYPRLPSDDDYQSTRVAFAGIEVVVTHDIDSAKLKKIKDGNDISIKINIGNATEYSKASDDDLLFIMKSNLSFSSYGDGHLIDFVGDISHRDKAEHAVEKWTGCGNVDFDFNSLLVSLDWS